MYCFCDRYYNIVLAGTWQTRVLSPYPNYLSLFCVGGEGLGSGSSVRNTQVFARYTVAEGFTCSKAVKYLCSLP